MTEDQRQQIRALATDLRQVWDAPTTTDRDRKELLQGLLEEVKIEVLPEQAKAHLVLRWKTGAHSELDVLWRVKRIPPLRTDEDTIDLVRRLALHHPDAIIAGVLSSQGRKTATGERFTADKVGNLRRYWKIPRYEPPASPPEGNCSACRPPRKNWAWRLRRCTVGSETVLLPANKLPQALPGGYA